jgi:hypothetical protein
MLYCETYDQQYKKVGERDRDLNTYMVKKWWSDGEDSCV